MADYWISFRVKEEGNHGKRYEDLVEAIDDCATGGQWSANTSFVGFRSDYSIDHIGQKVKGALNSTSDHLVLRQIDVISTRYINEPGEGFLALFPKAIKL